MDYHIIHSTVQFQFKLNGCIEKAIRSMTDFLVSIPAMSFTSLLQSNFHVIFMFLVTLRTRKCEFSRSLHDQIIVTMRLLYLLLFCLGSPSIFIWPIHFILVKALSC